MNDRVHLDGGGVELEGALVVQRVDVHAARDEHVAAEPERRPVTLAMVWQMQRSTRDTRRCLPSSLVRCELQPQSRPRAAPQPRSHLATHDSTRGNMGPHLCTPGAHTEPCNGWRGPKGGEHPETFSRAAKSFATHLAMVLSGRWMPSKICSMRPGPSCTLRGLPVRYTESPTVSPEVSS